MMTNAHTFVVSGHDPIFNNDLAESHVPQTVFFVTIADT